MKFQRKKKRGLNQKTRRLWLSVEEYRIVWRKEVHGIDVKPAYQACVRIITPGSFEGGDVKMWGFVEREKRLYRTMKAAVTACEQHYKLWNQAKECTTVRAIQELFGHRPPGIPKWVVAKLDRRVSAALLDSTLERQMNLIEKPEKKVKRK